MNYADRLRKTAVQRGGDTIHVVLFGTKDNLSKREEIRDRLTIEDNIDVHILDQLELGSDIRRAEYDIAREAVANIFLIDPHWRSFGPYHELSTIIDRPGLWTVAIIAPDGEPPKHDSENPETFTVSSGLTFLDVIDGQVSRYDPESWPDCNDVTSLCRREIRKRARILDMFPARIPRLPFEREAIP